MPCTTVAEVVVFGRAIVVTSNTKVVKITGFVDVVIDDNVVDVVVVGTVVVGLVDVVVGANVVVG